MALWGSCRFISVGKLRTFKCKIPFNRGFKNKGSLTEHSKCASRK